MFPAQPANFGTMTDPLGSHFTPPVTPEDQHNLINPWNEFNATPSFLEVQPLDFFTMENADFNPLCTPPSEPQFENLVDSVDLQQSSIVDMLLSSEREDGTLTLLESVQNCDNCDKSKVSDEVTRQSEGCDKSDENEEVVAEEKKSAALPFGMLFILFGCF